MTHDYSILIMKVTAGQQGEGRSSNSELWKFKTERGVWRAMPPWSHELGASYTKSCFSDELFPPEIFRRVFEKVGKNVVLQSDPPEKNWWKFSVGLCVNKVYYTKSDGKFPAIDPLEIRWSPASHSHSHSHTHSHSRSLSLTSFSSHSLSFSVIVCTPSISHAQVTHSGSMVDGQENLSALLAEELY